jgi:hypothetical protein
MGHLAQRAGQTDLVLGRDYIEYWPTQVDPDRCAGDNLYLRDVTETLRQEAKGKQVRRTLESAGPSTSASRQPRGRDPVVSPAGKQQCLTPSQTCNRGGDKSAVRGS